jgi:hypothetical protein
LESYFLVEVAVEHQHQLIGIAAGVVVVGVHPVVVLDQLDQGAAMLVPGLDFAEDLLGFADSDLGQPYLILVSIPLTLA